MLVLEREAQDISSVVDGRLDFDELDPSLRQKLYEHFLPEMPYGVAKARSGDPSVWIAERLPDLDLEAI
jgi:hypothetical protein